MNPNYPAELYIYINLEIKSQPSILKSTHQIMPRRLARASQQRRPALVEPESKSRIACQLFDQICAAEISPRRLARTRCDADETGQRGPTARERTHAGAVGPSPRGDA
jgi:hypothetical protein